MKPLVIKLGSALLSDTAGQFDEAVLEPLAQAVAQRWEEGQPSLVVSSGAVALGRPMLRGSGGAALVRKQASAAVGQARLMSRYREAFEVYGLQPAQVLLTPSDIQDRGRYLQACGVLRLLLQSGIVPVINENDVVSDEALRFGDNDRLAVEVAAMVEAGQLILMTVEDGVYDADPRTNSEAQRLHRLETISEELIAAMGPPGALGCGGMGSKLRSARRAQEQGIEVIIASGRLPDNWTAVMSGSAFGTVIPAQGRQRPARRDWIANTLEPAGALRVDAGAQQALETGGASLLAVGLAGVEGDFRRGDSVVLKGPASELELGRGLIRLDRGALDELLRQGECTDQILIHRDDLVMRNR
ncbi:MAG: glutamate 5-kinase [Myxococcales bacterium]|nr:glutamate 5-kinase [Myxococcales bacterium]